MGRLNLAGRDLTAYLKQMLTQRDHTFIQVPEEVICHGIKEKLCYVALDYDQEMKASETSSEIEQNFVLPDGKGTTVGAECFRARFTKELRAKAPAGIQVTVVAPPQRKYGAFIGGSIMSSLSTFEEMWVTKDDYDEDGPSIVHRKCF